MVVLSSCLFCRSPLPNKVTGKGDHVIPESLKGTWRIHDICRGCNSYFGHAVDALALRWGPILRALHHLNISTPGSILWEGTDMHDGGVVQFTAKGDKLRMNLSWTSAEVVGSEEDPCLRQWARINGTAIPPKQFEQNYDALTAAYKSLQPGQKAASVPLNLTMVKRRVENLKIKAVETPSFIDRLVAKTASEFALYACSPRRLDDARESYQNLRLFARYGSSRDGFTIHHVNAEEYRKVKPYHRLSAKITPEAILIELSLFSTLHWLVILSYDTPQQSTTVNSKCPFLICDFSQRLRFATYVGTGNTKTGGYEVWEV